MLTCIDDTKPICLLLSGPLRRYTSKVGGISFNGRLTTTDCIFPLSLASSYTARAGRGAGRHLSRSAAIQSARPMLITWVPALEQPLSSTSAVLNLPQDRGTKEAHASTRLIT